MRNCLSFLWFWRHILIFTMMEIPLVVAPVISHSNNGVNWKDTFPSTSPNTRLCRTPWSRRCPPACCSCRRSPGPRPPSPGPPSWRTATSSHFSGQYRKSESTAKSERSVHDEWIDRSADFCSLQAPVCMLEQKQQPIYNLWKLICHNS